jgi:hypothetical protein
MRGGGVGFYIHNNLSYQIMENLSPFVNTIFECLTICLTYPASKKSVLISCAYRSNGILPNLSQSQQLEEFYGIFGDLLAQLQASNKDSYIFMEQLEATKLLESAICIWLPSRYCQGYSYSK